MTSLDCLCVCVCVRLHVPVHARVSERETRGKMYNQRFCSMHFLGLLAGEAVERGRWGGGGGRGKRGRWGGGGGGAEVG